MSTKNPKLKMRWKPSVHPFKHGGIQMAFNMRKTIDEDFGIFIMHNEHNL
jgi:hypothetical protein